MAKRLWLITFAAAAVALLVASSASARIPIDYWGGDGSGDGQLHYPELDAVDHVGNVYVADSYNRRIVKYSPSGDFLLTWGFGVRDGRQRLETCTSGCQAGIAGPARDQLGTPRGVAVHGERVYVTDPGNARVQVFTSTGRFLTSFGRWGRDAAQLSDPRGITTDPAGHVYVADYARIVKYTAGGEYLTSWGHYGQGTYDFDDAWGIAADANGIYVVDAHNHRIKKYTRAGRFLRTWGWGVQTIRDQFEVCTHRCYPGRYGSGRGEFTFPEGIATDQDGDVYVVDDFNGVQRFGPGGRYISKFQAPRNPFSNPAGIAIDTSDLIRVTYDSGYVATFDGP